MSANSQMPMFPNYNWGPMQPQQSLMSNLTAGMYGPPQVPQQSLMDWGMEPQPFSGGGVLADTSQFGFPDSFLNELVPGQETGTGWGSDFWFGKDGSGGAAMPTIMALSALSQGILGWKGLGLAEDKFDENKRQFNLNVGNQARAANASMEARHKRDLADGRVTGSTADYMAKYGMRT
jgi:hypothetical protein